MRRKHADSDSGCRQWMVFWSVVSSTCLAVYLLLSPVFHESRAEKLQLVTKLKDAKGDCCRGVEHLEYWGPAVKWGSEHRVNSSQECCAACKAMCTEDSPCRCNSWVYCGDRAMCGDKLGQCWLKKQVDPLNPDVQESGEHVMWTSGLVFGKDVGILVLETVHGPIRVKVSTASHSHKPRYSSIAVVGNGTLPAHQHPIVWTWETPQKERWPQGMELHRCTVNVCEELKFVPDVDIKNKMVTLDYGEHDEDQIQNLKPDCAPLSILYFIEVLNLRHCAGCQIYRAEPRGSSWDANGKHIKEGLRGPPFGLLQGTLDLQAGPFKEIPPESCPVVKRGMVGWISGGPDFFISLADHLEWPSKHTVFAHVIAEDMDVVEKISTLPTATSDWSGVTVAILKNPVAINISRPDSSNIAEVVSG